VLIEGFEDVEQQGEGMVEAQAGATLQTVSPERVSAWERETTLATPHRHTTLLGEPGR
jgi:hypothetical protein